MSVMQLTLLTSLSMMGAGIIMLPAKFAEIGAISMLSWIVTALASGAVAYVFAQCGMLSKKGGGTGRLCRICLWRTRRFYRQLCLCHFTRLRQHCHLSGSRKLWAELVPSPIFIRFCLHRLRAPFMDRIASHLPLPVHHRPHHRHLRLVALAALDYACRCRRLLV